MKDGKKIFVNGSFLIVESIARAGADTFVGYPITPSNYLYLYSSKRLPLTFHAPDEITTLQWMSGLSATGRLPITATSFPGFALMVESINMAFMMELPMVIILAQRLGPSTGTATCGASGDLLLIRGMISGGYPIPTLAISDFKDCWELPEKAVKIAVNLRTPVILLTSKETAMTNRTFDITSLKEIKKVERKFYSSDETYIPYKPEKNLVPQFLPLSSNKHQIRFTASTHDQKGVLQHSTKEALENSARLYKKIVSNLKDFTFYEYDEDGKENLIVTFDVSSVVSKEAIRELRKEGKKVSLLVAKTVVPIPDIYYEIISKYKKVYVVEENLNGELCEIIFGSKTPDNIVKINSIGKMISIDKIKEEVIKNG
ncbi:MAG: hypothetical protein QME48_07680 [bacterium]|uniref:KorA2: 2-oxoglutarate synthase, subunit A n=2 Tax=Bacteria candidate phyla TaxID=1783234 RepID=A0A101I3I1_UNCT6|nr:MAG: KorA2: 2-oxoglutarate synthase, subunit A [candidate division TA06 bacterium 32_111]KUK88281.1 MAG: KorA2: 2-oxoglutarate synthase, subunit A [candidate division TA06 bacterium 34_109]MDI6701089.1 hypothetical protein [bacterium]HAF07214.1 hypothetical protein [candidate division WOR-3 bacterium]HCP17138.1 hypothetical protein [candidate division WOR-3 bacterium]